MLHKTNREKIVDILLGEAPETIKKEKVIDRFNLILSMLTPDQKKCLLKKLLRCSFYVRSSEKGMQEKRIRSIMKRKFNIKNQNIDHACSPCKVYLNIEKYKKK